MASKAVIDAIEAVIGSTWSSVDGNVLPVIGLNGQSQPPADGSPHIEIEYPVANETWLTMGDPGNNQFREDGAFRLIINEERSLGIGRAQAWVDELRALYRGKAFLSGALQCGPASAPVINDANDLGNYFQFTFAVTYRFYLFG